MATVKADVQQPISYMQAEYSGAVKRALARKPALFINNEWVSSSQGTTLVVTAPAETGWRWTWKNTGTVAATFTP